MGIVFICFLVVNLQGQVDSTDFQTQVDTTCITPPSGQSKAGQMKNLKGDKESGGTEIERVVEELTGFPTVALLKDHAARKMLTPATGGAIVNGDQPGKRGPEKIFWRPKADTVGVAGIKMAKVIKFQYETVLEEKGGVVLPKVPWLQGESDISAFLRADNIMEAVAIYKRATKALFDYVEQEVGVPIDYFIVLTGFPDSTGMVNRGYSQKFINKMNHATALLRDAQRELIAENGNIHYGGDTDGIETAREADPEGKPKDIWHLSAEGCEEAGRRIGECIAEQMRL
ncbi:MAG: hypothetical protein P8P30_03410 [Rickettsiales bacterium]|nr:hypothetical protein [Rickettsiales bacterium]